MRPQVRHDGSAVGLQRVWKAGLEEQGKGCWCNSSGYGLTMTGNNPTATPGCQGIFSHQTQSLSELAEVEMLLSSRLFPPGEMTHIPTSIALLRHRNHPLVQQLLR